MAGDSAERRNAGFEIEIDPERDAEFGPRPVNAVQAAAIVTRQFPSARMLGAELAGAACPGTGSGHIFAELAFRSQPGRAASLVRGLSGLGIAAM